MSDNTEKQTGDDTLTVEKIQIPKRYKVILLNDDYSTMEFVMFILKEVFNQNPENAYQLMMKVHNEGRAVCGIYTKEIAETKVSRVHHLAKENGHPLKCILEVE